MPRTFALTSAIRLLTGLSALILTCQTPLVAQGFGGLVGLKKARTVTLKRLLPATVNLNGKRIRIVARGENSRLNPDFVSILKTKLITSIQKDNRFVVDDVHPETELRFSITNYYTESRQVPAPGSNPPRNCVVWTGKIEASYQAIEVRTQAPLDSENLKHTITVEDSKGAPGWQLWKKWGTRQGSCGTHAKASQNEARDELADAIDAQMAMRAAPSEESVVVPLPGGKLEPLSAMAMSQRWGTLLEETEKMPKLAKPEDDAYRIYLQALANEALAYEKARDTAELERGRRSDMTSAKAQESMRQEEANFTEAESYLDQATKLYKDAIQTKPGEKEFREPDGRMENAVRLYATIARHKEEYRQAVLAKTGRSQLAQAPAPAVTKASDTSAVAGSGTRSVKSGSSPAPAKTQPAPGPSAFAKVIEMCKDGVSGVAQLIKDHPSDLHFQSGLSLNEDLQVRRECGAEAAAITDAIKKQLPAGKKAP